MVKQFMRMPHYSPETSRAQIEVCQPSVEANSELLELLYDPGLHLEIDRGNITLAMIRPGLETSVQGITGDNDSQIAEAIEEHIQGLGVVAKFALHFDSQAINEFYEGEGGPKEVQLASPPERKSEFPNRWEEFEALATSGPTTVLLLGTTVPLLGDGQGQAVGEWRRQIGHWNILRHRDPTTLRGKFGLDNYNNLLHGSDSPAAVHRELDIITRCLIRRQGGTS